MPTDNKWRAGVSSLLLPCNKMHTYVRTLYKRLDWDPTAKTYEDKLPTN